MTTYKKTVVRDHPDYVRKKLLLADRRRRRLLTTSNETCIEVEFDNRGQLVTNEVKESGSRVRTPLSLRDIGKRYLGLEDPSVRQVLRHLVLPEMEVERIFNNLRHKYLQAIHLSKLDSPYRLVNASYNRAFQALAGIKVYQGGTKDRKDSDYFWEAAGFTKEANKKADFSRELNELGFILSYIRNLKLEDYRKIYAELIAIKPGFHEACIHPDFFEGYPKEKDPRTTVLRLLRGSGNLKELDHMNRLPPEMNRKSYFSYASCNVTEGPFVFRKKLGLSYFDEIRRIRSKERLPLLGKKFWAHDYYHACIRSRQELSQLLAEVDECKYFMHTL